MPLRDFICQTCEVEQERFYHQTLPYPACLCGGQLTVLERSDEGRRRFQSVFPFTTTHIDAKGRPMEITSMAHLRQVERQYGVALSVFNNEHNNSNDHLKDPPTYRGWDLEPGTRP